MPLVHDFGIINDINDKNSYSSYSPELNNCIQVQDEVVQELVEGLKIIKTYFHSLERPNVGLAYHGITLIPPESLSQFLDTILTNKVIKNFEETSLLCEKIQQAIEQNKYMIHYGI
ncbi:short-chain dehydrogenase [Lysinibacillus telephonicus]|uniref:short-chain dehydrogenase n=1 Tax=Lysinibacillus telephonicus TaxID=1714840 RepID=UPI0037CF3D52